MRHNYIKRYTVTGRDLRRGRGARNRILRKKSIWLLGVLCARYHKRALWEKGQWLKPLSPHLHMPAGVSNNVGECVCLCEGLAIPGK